MKMVVEGGGTKDYFYSDQPFFACEIIIHATAIGCLGPSWAAWVRDKSSSFSCTGPSPMGN